MKIKLGEIFNSQQIFERLIIEKLPFRTVINLSRLIERLTKELQIIESERIKLIKEYGIADEDNNYKVKDENISTFTTKLNELFAVEIEIADVDYFDDTEFQNITLSLPEYLQLKPFIRS